MKTRLLILLSINLIATTVLLADNVGVPSACPDVLLQGFYWDSYQNKPYGDTKWKTLLEQSSEIGAFFDGVWLPPSAKSSGGVGYYPVQYCNQNCTWGTRAELDALIEAFHNTKTKVIADIVINHTGNVSTWCDYATENFGEYGTYTPDGSYICSDDEVNSNSSAGSCKGSAKGGKDDGYGSEGMWNGARDWDHTSTKVQTMMKAYLKWLINDVKYDGFRYDYSKGYRTAHLSDYNLASQPYISFMEYWDGSNTTLYSRIQEANYNTMALDFSLKYSAIDGIAKGNYTACKKAGLVGIGQSKYAVNFIDNHDMFDRDGNEFGGAGKSMTEDMKDKLLCANAYILSLPGVPCLFYPHWAKYKDYLKPMINARRLAGIHSESTIVEEGSSMGYKATVTGTNGTLVLLLGDKVGQTIEGFRKITSGDRYAIWVKSEQEMAPAIIVTHSQTFKDAQKGIDVTIRTEGGSCDEPTIYYTTDGTEPTLASTSATGVINLHFNETTTLKVFAICGSQQSVTQTFTYTYKEPQTEPLTVKFWSTVAWKKVHLYAFVRTTVNGKTTDRPLKLNGGSGITTDQWPGTQWTTRDANNWYTYTFDESIKDVYVIFNDGGSPKAVQTSDLYMDENTCFYWDSMLGDAVQSPECNHPTAVENVQQTATLDLHQPMYNVLGIQVDATYKGIIIQGGKKFLLR